MKHLLLLLSVLAIVFASGCQSTSKYDDLFQYKHSYVGDNNAVDNILMHLQGGEYLDGLELKTKDEPYGIIIHYDWTESELNDKKTVFYNASYLFTLIQNLDWLSFHFDMANDTKEYKITREDLQALYEIKLSDIDNEQTLKEQMNLFIENKQTINQLFE